MRDRISYVIRRKKYNYRPMKNGSWEILLRPAYKSRQYSWTGYFSIVRERVVSFPSRRAANRVIAQLRRIAAEYKYRIDVLYKNEVHQLSFIS